MEKDTLFSTEKRPPHSNYYAVGWICAFPFEMSASIAMLDDIHSIIQSQSKVYVLGSLESHNIVLVCAPMGWEHESVEIMVNSLLRSFTNLQFVLFVGIGGASDDHDVRLGHVITTNSEIAGRISIQYAYSLNMSCAMLTRAISRMQSQATLNSERLHQYLNAMSPNTAYGTDENNWKTWRQWDPRLLTHQPLRKSEGPIAHYKTRESLVEKMGNLSFEADATGSTRHLPYVVIRGTHDNADSYTTEKWQKDTYSAAAAAAYTRELLLLTSVFQQQSAQGVVSTPVKFDSS
jgi:Phosphorylase superfamily